MNFVTRINTIKKQSGIKDGDGFFSVALLENNTVEVQGEGVRRISFCPTCCLYHYGYINKSAVGGRYDWKGVKEQECDACGHLNEILKNEIKKILKNKGKATEKRCCTTAG